jgi:hypothetical protein
VAAFKKHGQAAKQWHLTLQKISTQMGQQAMQQMMSAWYVVPSHLRLCDQAALRHAKPCT